MNASLLAKSAIALTCGLTIAFGSISPSASAGSKQTVRQGLPGRRISGGVRTTCFEDSTQSLVAVMPRNLLGKTAQAHPTFWFSLPDTQSAKSIRFELFDTSDNVVYSTQIDQSYTSGLSKVELPPTAPGLAAGENYRWVFDISCENDPDNASLEVQGWVRKVEISADLSAQIASASLAEQAYFYEEADLWHEQITALADLRSRNPASLEAQLRWAALVQASGLDSYISDNPLETTISTVNTHSAASTNSAAAER